MVSSYQEQVFYHYILSNQGFLQATKSQFFSNKTIRELFDIAKEHALKYKEPPSKDQMIELIQMKDLAENYTDDIITGLYNTKQLLSNYDDDWLEQNVGPWIQVRNLNDVMRKAIAYMKTTKVGTENASDVVEKIRHMISSETAIDFSFNLGSDFFDPTSHLQTRLARTPTGYKYIDLTLKGGWWKGSLIVFLSGPKAGKCVVGETKIKIRNKKTNKIKFVTMEEFHLMAQNRKMLWVYKIKKYIKHIFSKLTNFKNIISYKN